MSKTTLLSLDTSTTASGWAVFESGKLTEHGVIDLKSNKDTTDRMGQMMLKLEKLIEYYSPAVVAVETPVVVRNPQVQRMLTMIFGAVFFKCLQVGTEFAELRPTEWRKLVDPGKKPRKRDELKEWSRRKVAEIFGIEDISDDESDAVLIGQALLNWR